MTMRYIGGGHKKKYRVIDFIREKDGMPATVKTIEYDPNRTAELHLLFMQMVKKDILLLQTDFKLVRRYHQVKMSS